MRYLILLLLIIFPICSIADWIVKPKIVRNYDGDTITAEVQVFPSVFVKGDFRVVGVDTPEIRGGCLESKILAIRAKKFTEDALRGDVSFRVLEETTYGRWLAVVYIGKDRLDDLLIKSGLGRAMGNKEKRKSWCN